MNRQLSLIALALILAGSYVYFWTDLFKSKRPIQIYAQIRSQMPNSRRSNRTSSDAPKTPEMLPITFTLDDEYRLTELKVVEAEEYKTNKYAHPVWHLISDSSSSPTKGLIYGSKVKGMKPSIPKGRSESLHADTVYLLLIEAGKSHGEVNFKTRERQG
jgi:hypothetical protein